MDFFLVLAGGCFACCLLKYILEEKRDEISVLNFNCSVFLFFVCVFVFVFVLSCVPAKQIISEKEPVHLNLLL